MAEIRQRRTGGGSTGDGGRRDSTDQMPAGVDTTPGDKSVFTAFLLWLFGGWFGLHHLYLRRDFEAIAFACSGGGMLGIGWLRDLFCLSGYVADVNNDKFMLREHWLHIQYGKRPGILSVLTVAQFVFASYFRTVAVYALPQHPEDEMPGLHIAVAAVGTLVVSATIYKLGNIGRRSGSFVAALLGAAVGEGLAYLSFVNNGREDEDSEGFAATCSSFLWPVVLSLAFFLWTRKFTPGRQWKRRSLCTRLTGFALAVSLFWALWLPGLYFNATIEQDGETVRLKDCIQNIIDSPAMQQLKVEFWRSIEIIQEHGFREFWEQLKDRLDIQGEQRSYEKLGLQEGASQEEIRKAYKKLVRVHHPDKCHGDPAECDAKFQEIQRAYETLSELNQKRQAKNSRQQRGFRG